MKRYLKVSDVEAGDILTIRQDSKSFPHKFFKFKGESQFTCIRWTQEPSDELTDKILIYLGPQQMDQFLYHEFSCDDEKLFIRSKNFKFLRKV